MSSPLFYYHNEKTFLFTKLQSENRVYHNFTVQKTLYIYVGKKYNILSIIIGNLKLLDMPKTSNRDEKLK